ncbi:MAG: hypothetical protein V7L30_28110 [Nostoc sp.]
MILSLRDATANAPLAGVSLGNTHKSSSQGKCDDVTPTGGDRTYILNVSEIGMLKAETRYESKQCLRLLLIPPSLPFP